MPKLKPEVQHQRRERILDAAERCFARTGFHRTTMHDICRRRASAPERSTSISTARKR